MPAPLGTNLILDMQGRRACLDEGADRAADVERARAKSGVHVDKERKVAHVRYPPDIHEHVIKIGYPQIRQSQ